MFSEFFRRWREHNAYCPRHLDTGEAVLSNIAPATVYINRRGAYSENFIRGAAPVRNQRPFPGPPRP